MGGARGRAAARIGRRGRCRRGIPCGGKTRPAPSPRPALSAALRCEPAPTDPQTDGLTQVGRGSRAGLGLGLQHSAGRAGGRELQRGGRRRPACRGPAGAAPLGLGLGLRRAAYPGARGAEPVPLPASPARRRRASCTPRTRLCLVRLEK